MSFRILLNEYSSCLLKTLWMILVTVTLISPCLALKVFFPNYLQLEITLACIIIMAINLVVIIMFSYGDRRRTERRVRNRASTWTGISTGILVVGYREDPLVLESCLKSLQANRYKLNQRILLIIDGNELEDEYMSEIFKKVFRNSTVLKTQILLMNRVESDPERVELVDRISRVKGPVCVMQPHHGKRSAMYTGFTVLHQDGVEAVVVTDSDTFLHPNACKELAFALDESPSIGAATGDIRIYNTNTWLSFLCSLHFWYAFNMKRGADSYHGAVNCVSGPLGIYRMSIIIQVMNAWVTQSFLGVICSYGDDRHLTNLVLNSGYKVKTTHAAICYTDTPPKFIAWVTQQTRWSKSYFREFPIQLSCWRLHSPWMTYQLMYTALSSWAAIYILLYVVFYGTTFELLVWILLCMLGGLIITGYALGVTRERRFVCSLLYGFFCIFGFIPAKIFAALTLYNNSWGTSTRLFRHVTKYENYFAPIIWAAVIVYGLLHKPDRFTHTPDTSSSSTTDCVLLSVVSALCLTYLSIVWWMFIRNGEIHRNYIRDFSLEELFDKLIE